MYAELAERVQFPAKKPNKQGNSSCRWVFFAFDRSLLRQNHLGAITYPLTGTNWSFLLTCCTALPCTEELMREVFSCKHCIIHTSHCGFELFFIKNWNHDVCNWQTNAVVFPHNCTFLHFSAKYLLLNMLPLSSEVRAMQGLKVMPGSMALDKDLVKAE